MYLPHKKSTKDKSAITRGKILKALKRFHETQEQSFLWWLLLSLYHCSFHRDVLWTVMVLFVELSRFFCKSFQNFLKTSLIDFLHNTSLVSNSIKNWTTYLNYLVFFYFIRRMRKYFPNSNFAFQSSYNVLRKMETIKLSDLLALALTKMCGKSIYV